MDQINLNTHVKDCERPRAVLLGCKAFVSVSLCFHSAGHRPPTGLSPGSSLTLWLINGSWRCPVISSPNNKLQPQAEGPLRPTGSIPILTTRRQPITQPLAHRFGNALEQGCGHLICQGHNPCPHQAGCACDTVNM